MQLDGGAWDGYEFDPVDQLTQVKYSASSERKGSARAPACGFRRPRRKRLGDRRSRILSRWMDGTEKRLREGDDCGAGAHRRTRGGARGPRRWGFRRTRLESYTYDVFGQPTVFDANGLPQSSFQTPTSGNRFLYTGREYIAEAGLYDYRNRHYSPTLGRFLQTDPIRFSAGDVNLYRYVENSVLVWVDPWGLIHWGRFGAGLLTTVAGVTVTIVTSPSVVGVVGGGATIVAGLAMLGSAFGNEAQMEITDEITSKIPTSLVDAAGNVATAVTGDPTFEQCAMVFDTLKSAPGLLRSTASGEPAVSDLIDLATDGAGLGGRSGETPE